jgi:hypothetical protein
MSKGIYEEYGKLPILFRKTTDFNGVPDIGLVYIGLLPQKLDHSKRENFAKMKLSGKEDFLDEAVPIY